MQVITKIENNLVKEIFESYPKKVEEKLMIIRNLILEIGEKNSITGGITETLKWSEPSYVTKSGSGSTIRLAWVKGTKDGYGVFFNCRTTIISSIKEIFGDQFKYSGTRAIIFNINDEINKNNLKYCIELALTYHIKK